MESVLHEEKNVTILPSKLMEFLTEELKELPDERTGENKKYQVKEAVMAGFPCFFLNVVHSYNINV
jgi:hypothetical protein